jgi:ribonucleoside-diphosphate reductase subunit M2
MPEIKNQILSEMDNFKENDSNVQTMRSSNLSNASVQNINGARNIDNMDELINMAVLDAENLNNAKNNSSHIVKSIAQDIANDIIANDMISKGKTEFINESDNKDESDKLTDLDESEHSVDSISVISIDDNSDNNSNDNDDDKLMELQSDSYSKIQSGTNKETDAEIIKEFAKSKTYSKLLLNVDLKKEREYDLDEHILDEHNDRLVLKPINKKFKVIWDLYKKQAEAFWTPEKIDFSRDKHDFRKLNGDVQKFIKKILAFFAGADSIVNINIQKQFSRIKVKEANVAYAFQEMMENIHSEVYSDMLDNIITKPAEKEELINAFKTVESIRDMIGWGEAWIESKRRIGFSVMAFTIFEGLMFSGAFAAVYWLKNQLGDDKMQGLIGSNEFIARDEGMHTNFGCIMYDFVVHKLTVDEARIMMTEAVEIAKNFNRDAIKIRLIGMNEELMGQYMEYVADRLMVYLGYDKIYGTAIPEAFSFMEQIGILNKNNFFERRTSEYQMAHSKDNTADWQFRIIDKY